MYVIFRVNIKPLIFNKNVVNNLDVYLKVKKHFVLRSGVTSHRTGKRCANAYRNLANNLITIKREDMAARADRMAEGFQNYRQQEEQEFWYTMLINDFFFFFF